MSVQPTLRLGTPGSLLARSQSALVADQLQSRNPGLVIETRIIKTTGDRITDRPLHEAGGKGLFVKELEEALLAGEVDFAVHSCKDVPVTMPLVDQSDLIIAAVPLRHDPQCSDFHASFDAGTIAPGRADRHHQPATPLPIAGAHRSDLLMSRCAATSIRESKNCEMARPMPSFWPWPVLTAPIFSIRPSCTRYHLKNSCPPPARRTGASMPEK